MHTPEDMRAIGEWLKGAKAYYLQPFKDSGDILAGSENICDFTCENAYTEALLDAVKPYIPNSSIRG
jgi:pyruvate formate lyase activating enzyme